MKKAIALSVFLVLSGCAKERTTKYFANQGQLNLGTPITSVLINEDEEKQKLEKIRSDSNAKPHVVTENEIMINAVSDQEDLAVLFQSFTAREFELPKPDGVVCEFIPQLRIQKTIGRLSCVKQSPLVSDEELIKKSTKYQCSVDPTHHEMSLWSDHLIYESLSIEETESAPQDSESRTFIKKSGRFYCEKTINVKSGDLLYFCGVQTPMSL